MTNFLQLSEIVSDLRVLLLGHINFDWCKENNFMRNWINLNAFYSFLSPYILVSMEKLASITEKYYIGRTISQARYEIFNFSIFGQQFLLFFTLNIVSLEIVSNNLISFRHENWETNQDRGNNDVVWNILVFIKS